MAQVTGAISGKDVLVQVSTDGAAWTDISGAATTVTPSGGNRMRAETYTFDGDSPITTIGKQEPMELVVTIVYTEGASDAFETLRPLWENGSAAFVRYSPKGGQTGEKMYTSPSGHIIALNFPTVAADNAAPVMSGFTWRGGRLIPSTVV